MTLNWIEKNFKDLKTYLNYLHKNDILVTGGCGYTGTILVNSFAKIIIK